VVALLGPTTVLLTLILPAWISGAARLRLSTLLSTLFFTFAITLRIIGACAHKNLH